MRTQLGLGAALAVSVALLGACSKPADTTADATTPAADAGAAASNTAAAATDTTGGAMAAGGAVSPPPANGNEAINPDANKGEAAPSAASNSFTEGQARGHIENAGYADVTGLTKTPDGLWVGQAKKGGKTMDVSVDFKGAVTAK